MVRVSYWIAPRAPAVKKQPMPLPPVLFADDALLAFDLPADLPVAPGRGGAPVENLVDLVRARFGAGTALVHRLDPGTSGLVFFARSKPALDYLSGQFQSKTVEKVLLALTAGLPAADEFTVDLVMKEDEARPGRMCVVKKHGHASVTRFTVTERFPQPAGRPGFALVECRPVTGRPHQVRLHLAEAGAPVLNDPVYGSATPLLLSDLKRGYKGRTDERPLIARLALHAASVTFRHPLTREPQTLAAPLPKDLAVALRNLRKFAPGSHRR
ncbi:MAG: RluA family pseudouridine synthase [Streptosporangiaceae bacterium]